VNVSSSAEQRLLPCIVIDALILSVGGFLGVGEHYVAVSPSSVNVRYDSKNDKWLASMNTTKDALKAAPEFKYPK
jgi:hypothetical protein